MRFIASIGLCALYLLPLFAVACFPPQRRAGNWTDVQGRTVAWTEATPFDRFEFGYVPTFQWVGDVGTCKEIGYTSKTTIGRVGPLQYRYYCWVVDIPIAVVLAIACVTPFLFALRYRIVSRPRSGV
jgi:hypothetical protein